MEFLLSKVQRQGTATVPPALKKNPKTKTKMKEMSQDGLSEGLEELLGQEESGMSCTKRRKQSWSEVGLLLVWI